MFYLLPHQFNLGYHVFISESHWEKLLWQRIFCGGFALNCSLHHKIVRGRSLRLLLKGMKRSDLICHDSCQSLHWLINVFLLITHWFQHNVTVATRWRKITCHILRTHTVTEVEPWRNCNFYLCFTLSYFTKPSAVVGCADRKGITTGGLWSTNSVQNSSCTTIQELAESSLHDNWQ